MSNATTRHLRPIIMIHWTPWPARPACATTTPRSTRTEARGGADPRGAAPARPLPVEHVLDDHVHVGGGRAVALGEEGALAGMGPDTLLVDHTTASQELALELDAACAEQGIGFLDAPVSGGQAGAENGMLTVMVGGRGDDFETADVFFQAYAKKSALLGAVGAGQLTKMVNQICIAGVLQGLAEGVHFAQRADLDVNQVVDVIAEGAAQSWQMENRSATMAEDQFEFGFAVNWMRKDLGIALRTGEALGARLPLTALVNQFYGDVQAMGGGRWDTSSLLRRLTRP